MINDCINIENNIKEINIIDEKIKKCNNIKDRCNIKFYPKEDNISEFLKKIKSFGNININNFFQDSIIVTSKENYNFIFEYLEKSNISISNSKLIYRATRDGDSYDNLFNKYNGIKNIIVLIKSNNNCIFGGFTKVGFQKSFDSKFKDDSAFVFSLDKKLVYPIKKGKDAVRCCNCCCPQFCINTIYLSKNFLSNSNQVNAKDDNYKGFTINYELNNGTEYFKVLELEIYQIIFI